MNTKDRLRRELWRLGYLRSGFLEGERGWGTARVYIVVLAMFAVVVAGALIELLFNQILPQTWLEKSILAQALPTPLLRFIALTFSLRTWRYLVIPLLTMVVAVIAGTRYIQDIYELSNFRLAMRYLLACLFNWNLPYLRIQGGKPVLAPGEENLLAAIGGPGYIFVTPGSAVLFESLTHPSSVRDQGRAYVSRYESISDIVDLSDQHGYIEKSAAMTKDGIIVTVHDIHFRYRVQGGRRYAGLTGRSPQEPYPYSPVSIRHVNYTRLVRNGKLSDWHTTVQNAFDGEILNYIRARRLDEIITAGKDSSQARDAIRKAILSPGLRNTMKNYGTELVWFDIGHFSYDEPVVEEQWILAWAADWAGRAEVKRAEGDAQREAIQELARSEAQAEVVNAMVKALETDRLTENMNQEAMSKLFLMKAGQILDSLSQGYQPNPNGD